ncbi:nuclear transport factor 2 family protein [Nonomuraea pusilla]|uniref:nuclear transport factor 2 family protein n=1 Tax=Nonomuraea pusilla TaxID=46177 RepID=UPI003332B585
MRRLMARYVRYADHQRWQDLAHLFTPDGTFTPHKPDGSVWLHMEGREAIAATVGAVGGPGVTPLSVMWTDIPTVPRLGRSGPVKRAAPSLHGLTGVCVRTRGWCSRATRRSGRLAAGRPPRS